MQLILSYFTNATQNFVLHSSKMQGGIFNNQVLERLIETKEPRKQKMSKYEIEILKWKGEMDNFEELNIELNFTIAEYNKLKEFAPEIQEKRQVLLQLV